MKKLIIALATFVATQAFASSLLSQNNFFRLDQDVNELAVYVPDGHCTVQMISNHSPLYSSTHSSSHVGPALKEALEISRGEINFVKHRLTVDLSKIHHGGYGTFVTIKTKSGRNLKDVIKEIIPDEDGEESTLILTLIGNGFPEQFCSFH